ncbi:MAG: hypothetical protein IJ570_05935 [Prevotella sp.]|nr:hypothetical protein [Prevotella sp.]
MKTTKNYVWLGAIALLATTGLSSCSSDEDVPQNPFYNPDTKEVTTNFVFNVSTSNTPSMTRMSREDTQAELRSASEFRGITNAELLSFKQTSGTALADGRIVSTPSVADKLYAFGTLVGSGRLDPNASSDLPMSRRVIELSLPTETNTLLLYGKAIKTGTDAEQGKITWNVSDNLSNISFSLCKVVPETPDASAPLIYQEAFQQYQNLMAKVLTEIVNSKVPASTVVTFGTESITLTNGMSWGDYVNISSDKVLSVKDTDPIGGTSMSALGDILSKSFVTLNTIYPNELRAGSGSSISFMMKEIMVVINSVVNAVPVSLQEVVAQRVAEVIKTNVETYFDAYNDYEWKSAGTVKTNLSSVLTTDKNLVSDASDLNDFPTDFNLPLGSVILQFTIDDNTVGATRTFTYAYKGTVDTYAMGGSTQTVDAFDPKNYVYPAELCYFGNSPLRVTNETKATNDYPDGVVNWNDASKWGGWTTGGHILSTTRSVAMQYSINYGTALLATTVRYGAKTLQDNNANIQYQRSGATEANNNFDVSLNDTHFQLTGVLVGGQEPEVGWNYLAKSTTPGFGSMVYDNVGTINIPAATADNGGEKSAVAYTLLWDNWQESLKGQKQREVYVALEFKNNTAGFWGENNFIREGGTFYIVGKLDPNSGRSTTDLSEGITWPDNQALPPYAADGSTVKQRRVFMQDFMTTADFVIGPTSLQHALVAVPDLRSGQISLGLSVDLHWQTGLSFNNIILGD